MVASSVLPIYLIAASTIAETNTRVGAYKCMFAADASEDAFGRTNFCMLRGLSMALTNLAAGDDNKTEIARQGGTDTLLMATQRQRESCEVQGQEMRGPVESSGQ